ncbi:MAG: MBL fold metallo-hydrolase [Promethearchaeota archaeon]
MEIFWISHAAFKIKTESGKIIYLDPYQLPKEAEKADIIISSHSHGDHFDNRSIKTILKDSSILIGPVSISNNLKKFNGKGLKLGEIFEVDDIKIVLVPSYTIKKGTHPKSNEWAGIVIETEGKTVYHAGDTENIPEMKDLKEKNITVALLPCGGRFTMDFEESCSAALEIEPKIVVPMHNLYMFHV